MKIEETRSDQEAPEESAVANQPVPPHPFTVVGIGASAGGLEALQSFFANVPADSGMVYVVILHLDPDRESQMANLLQKQASIPVMQVTEPVKVEPDHAYIIPPGQDLSMLDGTIQMSDRERGQHTPIDLFLTTLGDAYGPNAVGIVLSGSGSDGTVGLRRLKEAGGITIAQTPEDAEYDSMPRSAIATGQVDVVLAAGEMPGEILRIQRTDTQLPTGDDADSPPPDDEAVLRQIFGRLRGKTGHNFSDYKRSTVLRRIDRRMRFNGLKNLAEYLGLLRDQPDEIAALFQDLLISVSSFFRDAEAFEAIEREVIPKLFEGKGARDQVRVWVPGCATGEEVYSLAILLAEHAATLTDPPEIQLFASDIDENSCARAREGAYPETIVEDVTSQRIDRFFDHENGAYRVKKPIRKLVLFAKHDLLKDPPFSRLDLVSCRNVLIYLDSSAQQRALESFYYALCPEGFLFLGTAESAEAGELFVPILPKQRIYRRGAVSHAVIPRLAARGEHRRPADPPPEATEVEHARRFSFGDLHQRMLEAYAPPSLIVNEDGEIVHLSERAGRFLRLSGGEPTSRLVDLATGDLRLELRTALYQALQKGMSANGRARIEIDHQMRMVDLEVHPIEVAEGREKFALVIFSEQSADGAADDGETTADKERTPIAALEEELRRSREQLESVLRARDLTIEELQSANEELQSTNEEHKATTEELETSREELQSINEELTTINQEHRATIEELKLTNSDLRNLMEASEIGTLFLDRQLRIRRFTPSLRTFFNLAAADLGRPISHVTHALRYDSLAKDAETVIASLEPIEQEIESEAGDWFSVRLHPYRSADDRIEGAIVTFYDVTDRKKFENEAIAARAMAEEANRVKGMFLATLSHEFRTPLNGMLGYADLLLFEKGLSESQVQKVERIKGGAWHLARMIDEILAFAKLDAGHEAIAWEKVDARTIANEAAMLVEPGAAAKRLRFKVDLPDSAIQIKTDGGKARQILVNLLGNAIKYTERGEIGLSLHMEDGDHGRVVFTVRDTGIGIPAEHTEHVFERFWQVSGGLTRTSEGTGIGLAAARAFSRLLGGDVTVQSEIGSGSTFTLSLPIEAPVI